MANANVSSFKTDHRKEKQEGGYGDAISTFQNAAERFTRDARGKAQQMAARIPSMIRQYPLQSLAVGLGLGFVVGMILNREKNND